jgi:hypothetical protein
MTGIPALPRRAAKSTATEDRSDPRATTTGRRQHRPEARQDSRAITSERNVSTMKRIVTVAMCTTALLLSAAAASASAAEPTLYECVKATKVGTKYTGSYTNSTCTKLATEKEIEEGLTNKFEKAEFSLAHKKGIAKPFKGSGKGANLEVKSLGGVACTSSTNTGKFTGPKTAGGVVATFKGCELLHHQCSNTATLGEVKTNPMKGEVGYIEGGKERHEVGFALTAESGPYEAEFHCAEFTLRVSGTVIGLITSKLNVFTKEAKLLFQQSAGEQRLKKLEGGPSVNLLTEFKVGSGEFGSPAESGEATEVKNTGETLYLKA